MTPYLATALQAADAAQTLIRSYYKRSFAVREKADLSPVTEVDEAAEAAIKSVLRAAFPTHGFYGEESGRDNVDAEYLWLVDPIDGTKAFVRGYPFFSVQIALMHKGELIVGVSAAPCYFGDGGAGPGLGEVFYAERGAGAWHKTAEGPRPQHVSRVGTVDKATLSTGNLASLAQSSSWAKLGGIIPRLHRIRGYADFLHYHLLAAGRIDACVESNVNILDIAALAVIVREAGGIFTDLAGRPVGLNTTSVLAATPVLHGKLMQELAYSG